MNKLQILTIEAQNLCYIPEYALHGLNSLSQLSIASNSLIVISGIKQMSALQYLYLEAEEMTQNVSYKYFLKQTPKVKSLRMVAIEIPMNVLGEVLHEYNNIHVLALPSSNLHDIPLKESPVVKNIAYLLLQNNNLTVLKDESFLEYANVTVINLNNNRISHISKYSLAPLISLTAVYLLGNPLKFLDIVLPVLQTQPFLPSNNYFIMKYDDEIQACVCRRRSVNQIELTSKKTCQNAYAQNVISKVGEECATSKGCGWKKMFQKYETMTFVLCVLVKAALSVLLCKI